MRRLTLISTYLLIFGILMCCQNAWAASYTINVSKGTLSNGVRIDWTSSNGPNVSYQIYRSLGLNGTKSLLATISNINTYTDTTASAGVVYGYYVKESTDTIQSTNDYGYLTPVTSSISGTNTFTKVSVGQAYSLVLKSDGTLFAAGRNDSGYLGDGTTTPSKVFKQVLTGVQDILATKSSAYALKSDGTLWAAGPNYGSSWVQILSGVSSIHSDYNKSSIYAIRSGTAYTGSNSSNWAATTYTGVKQITSVNGIIFYLKTDGTVYSNYPSGSMAAIGTGFKTIVGTAQYYCPYGCYTSAGVLGISNDNSLWVYGNINYDGTGVSSSSGASWRKVLDNVADVKSIMSPSGPNILMVTKSDGTLWVTGSDGKGYFGDGTTSTYSYWKQVFDNVALVDMGVEDSIALRTNGTVWVTGTNTYGQHGLSDTTPRTTWTQTSLANTLTVSKATYSNKIVLTWDNPDNVSQFEVYRSLGLNGTKSLLATVSGTSYNDTTAGQGTVYGYYVKPIGSAPMSNNDYGYRTPVTTAISGTGNYTKISAGSEHSLALKSDGRLFAAGLNSNGQLGDGTTTTSGIFKKVLTGVQDILAGENVSFALKTDGTLWAAGNYYSTSWQQILSGVSSLSTNGSKTKYWAIVSGTVYTGTTASNWAATTYSGVKQAFVGTTGGGGMYGSSYTDYIVTLRTDGSVYVDTTLVGSGFKKIASTGSYWTGSYVGGVNHAIVGIKNDDSLWLLYTAKADGTGTTSGGNSWIKIFDDVLDIDTHINNYIIFAIKTDGTLWATSNSQAGIYGDGTSTATSYWKQVFDNVTSVSVGRNHTLALRSNGTIWVTGANTNKQHGLNDSTSRTSWTQTGFITPGKVAGVNASDGTIYSKVNISWTSDPDATQYDLYRSTTSGTKGSLLAGNLTNTSYDDTTVSGNIHYFYTVVAKSPVGSGPDSDQNEGYGKVPTTLAITATQGMQNGKVILAWTSNLDATGYQIWRSTTAGGTATQVATLTAMPASSYEDATVSGVSSYFYTIKTVVGTLVGSSSNEAEGWANGAPTSASASLTASSTAASAATSPTINDPNVTAGKTETYALTITTQPTAGSLTIIGGKFVYTPPPDGLFSGPLSFEFTATDKGGATISGTGSINVVCGNPTISSFTLPLTSVTQASPFESSATYSLPVCSTNGQIKVDVLDGNSVVVASGTPLSTPNGADQSNTFTNTGILTAGSYTVRMNATSDSGSTTKTATLTVKAVNLPTLSISPGLSVTVGEEIVTATISNPATVNCPFTSDPATATADPTQCYITFTSPPSGMSIDSSGAFPAMSGIIDTAGSYPIMAEVYKHNGTSLQKIGQVSKTVTASCSAPSITNLDIPALLPYEVPNYASTYKAYSCNGALSGSLTIKKNTTVIETLTLNSLGWGAAASLTKVGTGLPAGNYTAELSIAGSYGTAFKMQSFQVKAAPMPTLTVSPTNVPQGETRVDASLTPSTDATCPLTTVQAEAEADPKKCYVILSTTLPDMTAGTDAGGLPTLVGYPSTVGEYNVQAVISRWVNGTRYDSDPLTRNVKVTEVVTPVFSFTGKNSLYVGIEKASLIFKQDSGTTCTLYADQTMAQTEAAKGKRACFVNFTGDSGLTKTLSLNQYKLEGALTSIGMRTIGYTVKRQFADGLNTELQTGSFDVTVNHLPPPQVTLKGGYKITDGKYYVPLNQAITRATINAGVPTNAKMKITVTDSQQSFERSGVMNGGSYWISTPNLGLLEERPVTLRVAWQDYPQVYHEEVITAVGGTESNMKLIIDAPLQIADTEQLSVKVNVGKYTKAGIAYIPETMGTWRIQILAQTNTQNLKTPITEMKDAVNGEATFQINPAGNLFMKLTAVAELISTTDGLDTTLTSSTRYVEVVKGSPIEGTISAKALDGPAPKIFTLNLDMTLDNRVALKEVNWEESSDDGVTWTTIEKSNTIRHNIAMSSPGKRKARAKMVNKNTLIESYTTPVEVWAYATLDAQIVGPRHVAPGYSVTLAAQLYQEGVVTTDTVNEWTIEAPSGKTQQTGPTITVTEEMAGKIYVTLRSRPADTRADDPYAWSATRSYIIVATPTRPSIYAKGPRDVETGKTYHYEGVVRPSWGAMESVHSTTSEWALPDGRVVSGEMLDWSPTAQDLTDTKPLIFRSWVNGFKDSTTSETTVTYVPWEYVWPNWSITLKQLTIQAPSDLNMIVNHDRPDMNRRFKDLTYEWTFPTGVTGRQNEAFPNRALAQALYAGEYDIPVTIRDSRGNQTTLTQHVKVEQAMPYTVTLKVGKSNYYDRAPMTVTVRPVIYGGHPLDSVVGQSWKVDGVPVDEYANRSYLVSEILEAGNHTLSYTLTSKMGETATVDSPLFLVANQPPTCELVAKPNSYVVYAEASCKDADGKVIGYSWEVDGQPIGSTSYRISFTKTATPQTAHVTITAMDDAKELSTPVSVDVSY